MKLGDIRVTFLNTYLVLDYSFYDPESCATLIKVLMNGEVIHESLAWMEYATVPLEEVVEGIIETR